MDINETLEGLRVELQQSRDALAALQRLSVGKPSLNKIVEETEEEFRLTKNAVLALYELARVKGKRRGRRPKWIAEI